MLCLSVFELYSRWVPRTFGLTDCENKNMKVHEGKFSVVNILV